MSHHRLVLALGIALLARVAMPLAALPQDDIVQPDASLGAALRSLASRAATVFVGQVTSIDRSGDVVSISFRVDQGVAGSTTSIVPGPLILREWAGFWPPGEARYYPGERALVFLHAPSASGFASPVDGPEGLIPVLPQGADQEPLLDARRLDTRIQRNLGDPLPAASTSAIRLSDATTFIQRWREPAWQEPARLALPPEATPPVASQPASPQPAPSFPQRLVPSLPRPIAPSPMRPLQPWLPAPYATR
jgi:hypothetical protein